MNRMHLHRRLPASLRSSRRCAEAILPLLALLAVCSSALAQSVAPGRIDSPDERQHDRAIDASAFITPIGTRAASFEGRSFLYDASALRETLRGRGDVAVGAFPVDASGVADVVLAPARAVVDSRTIVRIGTPQGETAGTLPAVSIYRGQIRGERGSRVFLAAVGGELYGFVERVGRERFVIGPSTLEGAEDGAHVIAPESAFPQSIRDLATSCLADGTGGRGTSSARSRAAQVSARPLLEVRVAVEADEEFYRRSGATVSKATSYIIALWSMVSAIYEDEVDVTFRLPWIKVWTTTDPYQVAGNGYALWGKAPAYWRQNYADVERDLAHIFTASDWGGGGIAFRGEGIDGNRPVICSKEYGYAMSSPRGVLTYPTFAFTYDAYIVAHETGHNFGARHTHDCWWAPALDTCMTRDDQQFGMDDACLSSPVKPMPSSGSIMSYCMGINQKSNGGSFEAWSVNMALTPRVAAVMREEAELAACVRAPATPTIVLTNPRGRASRLPADTTLTITWNATGVAAYDVELSIDNKRSWQPIVTGLPADVLSHDWRVPAICSDSVWLRVVDASDASIGDTSLLRVSIAATKIPQISADGPLRICAGDSVRLSAPEGFLRYRWSNGDTARSTIARTSGSFRVVVDAHGGCHGEASVTVTVLPAPAKPVVTRRGDTLSTSGGAAWQWSRDGEPIDGATTSTLVVDTPGLYAVTVLDANGCRATSEPVAVSTSIVREGAARSRLRIAVDAPGPSDCCSIRFELPTSAHAALMLFDDAGRRVATLVDGWRASGSGLVRWDAGARAPGRYWAVLRAAGEGIVEPIVIVE